jgi:hypothetical protein
MAAMAALAFTAAIGQAVPAVAQSAEAFYRGKTIKLIVPSGAGGAYGLYALLLAGHYGRHIPGNPSIVADFRSGAGGTVAANYLYNAAPKDGSVIGMPLAPIVLAQHTRGKSAKYDASKFIWIGRMAEITRLFSVWQTTKAQTLEDLSKMQVIVGSTGKGSETFMNPAVMNSLLGTKFKIVTGYKGSAKVMHALEQGEITGAFSTWGNFNGNHPEDRRGASGDRVHVAHFAGGPFGARPAGRAPAPGGGAAHRLPGDHEGREAAGRREKAPRRHRSGQPHRAGRCHQARGERGARRGRALQGGGGGEEIDRFPPVLGDGERPAPPAGRFFVP